MPLLSSDGRFVLFASTANNLAAISSNNPSPVLLPPKENVFLRDRVNGTTTLVSVNAKRTGGGNGDSWPAALSVDGHYALFESIASDLVPNDTNRCSDVFLRDLLSQTTWLVSISTNSGAANGTSGNATMTPDARFIAFVSAANDLVAADTNGISDLFVRDMQLGSTVLASPGAVSTNHTAPSGGSDSPIITPDGRYVAFYSTATNLVPGVRSTGEVYIRDLMLGVTTWASGYVRSTLQTARHWTNPISYGHVLSTNGDFIAFEASTNPPSAGVVLRYSLQTALTEIISTNAYVPAVPNSTAPFDEIRNLDMSPDGRFIAFVGNASGTSSTSTAIYLWDAQTALTTLISGDQSNSVPANSRCDSPAVAADGQFVLFLSTAANLVTNQLNGDLHLYRRDILASTTALTDADSNGIGSLLTQISAPSMSSDGRFVAFTCPDDNLVPGDRNGCYDVFVRNVASNFTELISGRATNLFSAMPNGLGVISGVSLNANAHLIAFASDAADLVAWDTNACRDVFVRDVPNNVNIAASISTNGIATGDGVSTDPALNGDGRYVAFASSADNLVFADTNKASDVFVRDLLNEKTILVSVNTNGEGSGSGSSFSPSISSDGNYVLFHSLAANLASGSAGGIENLYFRDLSSSVTRSISAFTTFANAGLPEAMTPDGRYVAFGGPAGSLYIWDSAVSTQVYSTTSPSLVTGIGISTDGTLVAYSAAGQVRVVDRVANTNWQLGPVGTTYHPRLRFSADGHYLVYVAAVSGTNQVYCYDFQSGTNILVSQSFNSGLAANGASDSPDITDDGRFIAYRSAASDIVPGDSNGVPDVFLYDRTTGATLLLTVSRAGGSTADNRSLMPVFSGDGQTVLLRSWASDLVVGDFNRGADLFAYKLFSSSPIPLFQASVTPATQPAGGFWVTWPAVPGKSYRVQFKNNLMDPTWEYLDRNVRLVGGQGYLNDLSAASTERFYRVVAFD